MEAFAQDTEYIVLSFDRSFAACKVSNVLSEAHHTYRLYCNAERMTIPSILPESCEDEPEFTPECNQVCHFKIVKYFSTITVECVLYAVIGKSVNYHLFQSRSGKK